MRIPQAKTVNEVPTEGQKKPLFMTHQRYQPCGAEFATFERVTSLSSRCYRQASHYPHLDTFSTCQDE